MRLALILLLAVLLPLPSPAQETQPPASVAGPDGVDAAKVEEWRAALVQAQERVVEAHAEVEAAQQAFRDARKRRRRGAERGALLAELDGAKSELAEAEARLPELVEEARRAGVPRGVLDEFED